MVTWQDDVVVSYGMGEEIVGLLSVCKLYHLLGATEVGLGLVAYQLTLSDKAA